jgi:photosystem II stability/assembly factor-like uncharacterized protein
VAMLAALLLSLSGCEAPLELDGVARRATESVRRSDQFQMAGANSDAVVVVGNQGLVLVSRDRGQNWKRSELPGWPELISVTSCPDGSFAALAAEGQVWLSADDGENWQSHPLDSEEATQDITCDPQNGLWVVGSFSSIFSSKDGGETWELNSLDEDTILTNIQFLDAQTGFISGEFGTLLKTTDGGATWERLPDLVDGFYPQAMHFRDASNGWILGLQGQILHTADGGESWDLQQTDTLAPLFGITQLWDKLYVVGGEGTVMQNQGDRWATLDHGKPIFLYLRAVLPVDNDRLLVAGQAGALFILSLGNH